METKSRQRRLTKQDRLLADRIRQLREKQGLTQEQLSERIGRNYSYITYIETYRRGLSLPILFRIAQVFGVQIKDLFDF